MYKSFPKACKIIIKTFFILFFILNFSAPLFAGAFDDLFGLSRKKQSEADRFKVQDPLAEQSLTNGMQDLSRKYRLEGLAMQKSGDLEGALKFFQMAIYTDPFYAVAYNDLGVVYEAMGDLQLAKGYYLRATQIDPGYLSGYSNLALAYEAERDLKTAATYWQKRIEFGSPDDTWTKKAQKHYENIQLVLGEKGVPQMNEAEIARLSSEMADQKEFLREDDEAQAAFYLNKARAYYRRGDLATALKEAINARQYAADTKEIDDFIDKAQKRLLTR